ncbi:TrkH family potassium uptake protein [Peptoniphilus equinus]|uniref:TrkH family potassium uptake protein n=1 Tax=Peptoniphilus equinus TaxID=3016343 RepID=A0ABY7QV28_9FIRM|nr:TrkH family potassium uptake protein [Peptoniphilus equinus]WBW50130.1 TrkH family potassium uptake protein [Peptoniphilus equinus]
MNIKFVLKILGIIAIIEGVFLLPPTIYAYVMDDGAFKAFVITEALAFGIGCALNLIFEGREHISPKDGMAVVTFGWVLASAIGALPLYLSEWVPTYIDAFFEIVSGFTTTGASVIPNIEEVAKSVVLWRSMTHWIGGMGILVFTLSLLPRLGVGGFQMFKAESPGPVVGKIDPKMSDTAKRLYSIYIVITLVLFGLLCLGGMSVFDSIIHTLGVVGTGGFSSKVASAGHFSGSYIPIVMSIFMIICGTNFTMHYYFYKGKFRQIIKDEELRLFYGIIFAAVGLIAIDLFRSGVTPFKSFVDALFQVTSIASTSGFATVDYDLWPNFSKFILLMLFLFGSCAGSTAGGLKIIRVLIMGKIMNREVKKVIHPKAMIPIKVNGKIINDEVTLGVAAFFGMYFAIAFLATLAVTFTGLDILSSFSSVVTMLSNVGPGFNLVGPTDNFAFFAPGYKVMFSALMLLGRLEFFTMIALLAPKSIIKGA